jgi:hypothetical protein
MDCAWIVAISDRTRFAQQSGPVNDSEPEMAENS